MVPIALDKTYNGSEIKFVEQKLWFNWLRHVLVENLAGILLVFVGICRCLHNDVMSY